MSQPYDQRNDADYELNTERLHEGLKNIKDKNLKATIQKLSELTGIHRNTIRMREWPVAHLAAIREMRKERSLQARVKLAPKPENPVKILQNRLDNARLELIYWFNLYGDMKKDFLDIKAQYKEMKKAKEKYQELYKEEKRVRLDAEQEIARLGSLFEELG